MLLASTSDLDDLIPTLVAYQVEWNKLHAAARGAERPAGAEPDPAACAEAFGGAEDDWIRVRDVLGRLAQRLPRRGPRPPPEPAHPHARRQPGRLRARDPPLDGPDPRRDARPGPHRPPAVLRLLQPALDGQPAHGHGARRSEDDIVALHRRARAGLPARGAASASARAAPRARGRTSSTTARACTTRAEPEDGAGVEGAHAARALGRHHPPLQPHRAARLRRS